jgi:hypothetical protein
MTQPAIFFFAGKFQLFHIPRGNSCVVEIFDFKMYKLPSIGELKEKQKIFFEKKKKKKNK